jgi:excisionase family DNA binding protein
LAGTRVSLNLDIDPTVEALVDRVQQRLVQRLASASAASPAERAYRVPDVASQLSISEREVWDLVSSGELDSITIGRIRLVPAAALDAYINRKLATGRESAE